MPNLSRSLFVISLSVSLLAACSKSPDPKAIAQKFWEATKTGNIEQIKPYVTKTSLTHEMMQENTSETHEGTFTLGEPEIKENTASIPTTIQDKEMNMPLTTVLQKEDGQWKVDVQATMMSMMGGAMAEMMKGMEQMGKTLGEGMGQAMQGIGEGLGEDFEKSMHQMGENMGKEIERALKEQLEGAQPTEGGVVAEGLDIAAQEGRPAPSDNKAQPALETAQAAPVTAPDKNQVLKVMTDIVSSDAATYESVSDYVGGVGNKVQAKLTKPIVGIYGGVDCEYDFEVSQPTVIVTSGGSNKIRVNRAAGFIGEVLFVKQFGFNEYTGGKIMSFEEYRGQ